MTVPEVIGRYEIIEELGRGAMGSVFKARDPAVGRIVALKTIHSTALEGAQSEEYRARFYREARASGVLAHPGIVPVFDVGEHKGAPFLVMEFVDGRTFADAIKKGERFTIDRVCEIGQQIADALGYAHRQGVIHRDIKPANILLTSRAVYGSERPRITDFGIAKLAASEITTTGQLLGTPSFMPPEQFTGVPIDGRADLFSLGVILYSLAAGEQPFPGETMTAVSYKVVHTEPIPPAKLNPAIPAPLESAILKCLAKNPAARYQTGEEIAQELAAIRMDAGPSAHQTLAPAISASDPTLGPSAVTVSHPSAQSLKVGTGMATNSAKGVQKPRKPMPFETRFAIVLLSIAGVATVLAGGWALWEHHRSMAALEQHHSISLPTPQPEALTRQVLPVAQPAPPSSAAEAQPSEPAPAPEETKPQEAVAAQSKPGATKPAPAKPMPAPQMASQTVAKSEPAPAPIAAAAPASHSASIPAFDPRKLDPNTNAKLKIDLNRLPAGVPYTVEMNGKVYLRAITGEDAVLDNLFVPPGVQEFRVTMRSGGQQRVSNIVSEDFKAKKRKTLKIELLGQPSVPASFAEPLSSSAKVFLSLK
jgi:serine/threonine protein kinase